MLEEAAHAEPARQHPADEPGLVGGAAQCELLPLGGGEVAVRLAVEVDADAAVDVHRGVRDPVAGVGRPELGDRDLLRSAGSPSLSRHAACHSVSRAPSTSM